VEKLKIDGVDLKPIDGFIRESPDVVSGKFEMAVGRIAKGIDSRKYQSPG